eukprot:Tbor_TRINITY_DN5337_c0_g1::TRINITY_DN5337_c0_g1_i1::g.4205::m.4205/K12831/SF3B4, SAP49; splicing factor 3B subunit 4
MNYGYNRNELACLVVSNLDNMRVDEEMIYELFLQFGRIHSVHWGASEDSYSGYLQRASRNPKSVDVDGAAAMTMKDRQDRNEGEKRASYCYVEYKLGADALYAYKVLRDSRVKLFGKEIRATFKKDIQTSIEKGIDVHDPDCLLSSSTRLCDTGARLYVYNLPHSVTEAELTSFFGEVGKLSEPVRLITDADGHSKGKAILCFRTFDDSDEVLDKMEGETFKDRKIGIQYAEMQDGSGRRHGNPEERIMAKRRREIIDKHREKVENAAAQQVAVHIPEWAQRL